MLIIMLAVFVPVTTVMIWYGATLYKHELKNALVIEQQKNEIIKNRIEAEIKRFKTLLYNKSDPLSFLIENTSKEKTIQQINQLLRVIVERESAVHSAMLLSINADIIAIYDISIGLTNKNRLSTEEKNFASQHWNLDKAENLPEVVIPSLGRTYISSTRYNNSEVTFKMAYPVGSPVKAILIMELDAERLLWPDKETEHGIGKGKTQDYILDQRGALISKINNTDYQPGDLMTHLSIARTALISGKWPSKTSYQGANGQSVYGTLTTIPSLGWTLISEVSVEKIIQPIRSSLIEMFLFTVLGIVLFVLFVMRWAKHTLNPIQNACDAIDHVARGDYDFDLKPVGIRELDAMISGIIYMTKMRKKAELELEENKQDLVITLNSIGDGVITCDKQGMVTRMNPVAEQLTGWTTRDALGLSIESVFNIVNASTHQPMLNPVNKVLATGETVHLSNHTTLKSKDGSEYHIADSAAPLRDNNNNILGMVLVFNDVTEQYQLRKKANLVQLALQNSEQEQREILNSMFEAVISIDEVGTILSFNKAAEQLFGYKFNEIKGENVKYLMPSSIARQHDGYLKRYMQTNVAHIIGLGQEVEGQHKTKGPFPMRLFIAELPKSKNGKRRFIGTCIDLTHIKQQEEQLRRSQKMDALGKLTGGIAHDYNNMLGVVLGYAELLKEALSDQPKLANYAHKIDQAGQRGSKLTSKLLSFSKHENTDAECVNINSLLLDMQHMLEKTLTVRIKLALDLDSNLWSVWLSSADMEDVILNMAINAMHAIEDSGKLSIKSQNEKINVIESKLLDIEPGDYIKLTISDNGCGMNKETQEKIFDPFYSTKGDKGTGLGLSQTYGFIERNKGAIKVYSEEKNGTQFILYIPRYKDSTNIPRTNEQIKMKITQGKETILVVDDETDLLNLSCEILMTQGYKVFSAQDAKQALKILQSETIDLVLSDVLMPDMDGFQLAGIIQKQYPNIKIQLTSGYTDNRETDHMDNSLRKNLLSKPFNSYDLLSKIRTLLSETNSKP